MLPDSLGSAGAACVVDVVDGAGEALEPAAPESAFWSSGLPHRVDCFTPRLSGELGPDPGGERVADAGSLVLGAGHLSSWSWIGSNGLARATTEASLLVLERCIFMDSDRPRAFKEPSLARAG